MPLKRSNLHWARPNHEHSSSTGVLVIAGSSGRLDAGRADLLARYGATSLALRWFGGEGQPEVPCEVRLETFMEALDLLAHECDRLAILGLSYGAEAALLTASFDQRVDAVVALAPTDVAWEGYHRHDDDPRRSKWTYRGDPIPFVPIDRTWEPPSSVTAFVELYERSRAVAGADAVEAAMIPVERIAGDVVLVVGGDDKVWSSSAAARHISARRDRAGLGTVIIEDHGAGHPVVLPGEVSPDLKRPYQVGGDEAGPERLGALAWPVIKRVLRLGSDCDQQNSAADRDGPGVDRR